jgi:hypothetical protein
MAPAVIAEGNRSTLALLSHSAVHRSQQPALQESNHSLFSIADGACIIAERYRSHGRCWTLHPDLLSAGCCMQCTGTVMSDGNSQLEIWSVRYLA